MLRLDDRGNHQGSILFVHQSAFAPPTDLLYLCDLGSLIAGPFRSGYTEHLRRLWRSNPRLFSELIELATGGNDLTLVDDWGDEPQAPRRVLAGVLKQIVHRRRQRGIGLWSLRPILSRSLAAERSLTTNSLDLWEGPAAP